MRRSIRSLALVAFAALAAAACVSVPLPELEGVSLYRKKCGGCHRFYAPSERTLAEWTKHLPEMVKRAKLTPEEGGTIRAYVEAGFAASHLPASVR